MTLTFSFKCFWNSRGRGSYRGRGGRGGNYYRQDRGQMQQHQSTSSSQHSNLSGKMPNWNQNMPNNPAINYNEPSMNMMSGGGMPRSGGGYNDGNYHDIQSNRYEMHNQFTINHRKTVTTTFYDSNEINKRLNVVYIWFSITATTMLHII